MTEPQENKNRTEKTKADLKAEKLLAKAKEKQSKKREEIAEKKKNYKDEGPIDFVKGTADELKRASWPKPGELVKWCVIVIVTVSLFALFAGGVDNFISTPLMYAIGSIGLNEESYGVLSIILTVMMFIFGLGAAAGVMLHQGGESEGISDSVAAKLTGGSGQAQKNLDRITLTCIIMLIATLLAMMIFMPQGYVNAPITSTGSDEISLGSMMGTGDDAANIYGELPEGTSVDVTGTQSTDMQTADTAATQSSSSDSALTGTTSPTTETDKAAGSSGNAYE